MRRAYTVSERNHQSVAAGSCSRHWVGTRSNAAGYHLETSSRRTTISVCALSRLNRRHSSRANWPLLGTDGLFPRTGGAQSEKPPLSPTPESCEKQRCSRIYGPVGGFRDEAPRVAAIAVEEISVVALLAEFKGAVAADHHVAGVAEAVEV